MANTGGAGEDRIARILSSPSETSDGQIFTCQAVSLNESTAGEKTAETLCGMPRRHPLGWEFSARDRRWSSKSPPICLVFAPLGRNNRGKGGRHRKPDSLLADMTSARTSFGRGKPKL